MTVLKYDGFSDGILSPYFVQGGPDDCSCDEVGKLTIDTTDYRPGASDNYSMHVVPELGDIGCCVYGADEEISQGSGNVFYYSFWLKFSNDCLFDSGAGKGPEVRGNGGTYGATPHSYDTRIDVGPVGAFGDTWNIPNPPLYDGYRYSLIPSIQNFSAYAKNGFSWGDPVYTGGLWSQNLNFDGSGLPIVVGSRYYIDRGYWYRWIMEVTVHYTAGRIRLWIKKEGDTERLIIDTAQQLPSGCCTMNGTNINLKYTRDCLSMNYNDHPDFVPPGNGANAGFAYWIDDVYVTTDKEEIPEDEDTGSASISPSISPSLSPSASVSPSKSPSISPSLSPSKSPSRSPSASISPSVSPSISPSLSPSKSPSISPSRSPSKSPSVSPSKSPSLSPSKSPSISPSISPSTSPSVSPSAEGQYARFILGDSVNIISSGENTTAQLTSPSGKTSATHFLPGRIQDDWSMSATIDLARSYGDELVKNGDMELDLNWDDVNPTVINERSSVDKYGGTYSRHINDSVSPGWRGAINTGWTSVTGKSYKISARYRIKSGTMRIVWVRGVDGMGMNITTVTGDSWQLFEWDYTETIGGSSSSVAFINNSNVNPCEFYVDDVSVKEIINKYTEIEWCIQATDYTTSGETYEFRVTRSS